MTDHNRILVYVVLAGFSLVLLFAVSRMNYLLFHSIVECSSIVVGGAIFFFAWNVQWFERNAYLLWLGTAFLCVAGLDFLHMLAYKGMGVFPDHDANLPTQLWIAARYLQSISLAVIPFLHKRFFKPYLAFGFYLTVSLALTVAVFSGIFPDCFVEGQGLTPFKIGSEYLISLILVGALWSTSRMRPFFEKNVIYLLMASIVLTIASELAFTFYISVFGFSNMAGHLLKIAAFYLIYRAIIQTGIREPHTLLFHELKTSEQQLHQEKEELSQALARIKRLQGLLPICSSCKKIRDDKGYWKQVDEYIREHSDAELTHSICPECLKELYPDFYR